MHHVKLKLLSTPSNAVSSSANRPMFHNQSIFRRVSRQICKNHLLSWVGGWVGGWLWWNHHQKPTDLNPVIDFTLRVDICINEIEPKSKSMQKPPPFTTGWSGRGRGLTVGAFSRHISSDVIDLISRISTPYLLSTLLTPSVPSYHPLPPCLRLHISTPPSPPSSLPFSGVFFGWIDAASLDTRSILLLIPTVNNRNRSITHGERLV